jgi:hypothetical protein
MVASSFTSAATAITAKRASGKSGILAGQTLHQRIGRLLVVLPGGESGQLHKDISRTLRFALEQVFHQRLAFASLPARSMVMNSCSRGICDAGIQRHPQRQRIGRFLELAGKQGNSAARCARRGSLVCQQIEEVTADDAAPRWAAISLASTP